MPKFIYVEAHNGIQYTKSSIFFHLKNPQNKAYTVPIKIYQSIN